MDHYYGRPGAQLQAYGKLPNSRMARRSRGARTCYSPCLQRAGTGVCTFSTHQLENKDDKCNFLLLSEVTRVYPGRQDVVSTKRQPAKTPSNWLASGKCSSRKQPTPPLEAFSDSSSPLPSASLIPVLILTTALRLIHSKQSFAHLCPCHCEAPKGCILPQHK